GDFRGSLELWTELLKLNGMSKLAHNGYGKSLFSLGRYEEAMEEFEYTYNRTEYSNAWWEVRNIWITRYIGYAFAALAALAAALYACRLAARRGRTRARPGLAAGAAAAELADGSPRGRGKFRLWKDVLYIGTVLRHPIDSLYDLKAGNHGSVASASVVYGIAYAVFLLNFLLRAFLFRGLNSYRYLSAGYLAGAFLLPCALWVAANYLISSISDGEGSLKNVYVCTAYAFSPMILLMPAAVALGYACTLNEGFIVELAGAIAIGWTVAYFLLMVSQVHDFGFVNMIKNVLLTVFAIVCAIAAFLVVYLMAKQVIAFAADVGREVMFRAS
ncbi:MAG: YIP1 family protein, partial [Clostridiales bacterium]|nr:YIP1 family protein [Clostridiales bacterium]